MSFKIIKKKIEIKKNKQIKIWIRKQMNECCEDKNNKLFY